MFLLTFKDAFNEFLKNNALYLALGIAGAIVITFVVLVIVNRKKQK